MFRFTNGATIDFTLDDWREPPRPSVSPNPRRGNWSRTFDTDTGEPGEVTQDFGQDLSKVVRFVSSETLGFLTWAEVTALLELYSAGAAFTLQTDLLLPLAADPEEQETTLYTAAFEIGSEPVFTLVNPQREYHYMDIVLRLEEQSGS